MGVVRIIYRIMPTEPGENIVKKILDNVIKLSSDLGVKFHDSRIEPIAFGLYSLRILISLPETDNDLVEKFENSIKKLSGVQSIEVMGMTRA